MSPANAPEPKNPPSTMRNHTITRRTIIGALAAGPARAASFPWLSPDLPDATRAEARLVQPAEKRPMIQISTDPLALETPIQSLRAASTPNDQFFVHYAQGTPPDRGLLDLWVLNVEGDGAERSLRLSWNDLNEFPQTEILAVCESTGNRRGLMKPHVEGLQWGHGAIGCATWHGPRLRDILARAGLKPDSREIRFHGAGDPGYTKRLPIDKATASETMIATSMNGGPLPFLNGTPVRLVVPGWSGAYWVKHLTRIAPMLSQSIAPPMAQTEPAVASLIVSPVQGETVERSGFTLRGIAWDRGKGILRVDISLDAGNTWQSAFLDRELSPYAFRTFKMETGPLPRGPTELRVRATSNAREKQPEIWRPNPDGFFNNVPQRLLVEVA